MRIHSPVFVSFLAYEMGPVITSYVQVTESGRVATWLDETVSHVCGKLEHAATPFPELGGDR